MAGTTPKLALRYPTASDADDVPTDLLNLATDIETALGKRGLLTNLPAAGHEGRYYATSDTNQVFRDNGTTWDELLFKAAANAAYPSLAGGSVIVASGAAVKGLVVRGAASQTAPFIEYQNSSSVALVSVSAAGQVAARSLAVQGDPTNGDTIDIQNRTADPTAVAGYGRLYVVAGALRFVGSSGTVTTVAPA